MITLAGGSRWGNIRDRGFNPVFISAGYNHNRLIPHSTCMVLYRGDTRIRVFFGEQIEDTLDQMIEFMDHEYGRQLTLFGPRS